jgi:hypothetical protein
MFPDLSEKLNFLSVLNLRQVTTEFVGSYSCSDRWRRSSVHIYVDNADQPVAAPARDGQLVTGTIGQPALIPCRPTHPGFHGKLCINFATVARYNFVLRTYSGQ